MYAAAERNVSIVEEHAFVIRGASAACQLQLRVRRGTSSGGHHFQLRGLKLKALPEAAPEAAPHPGKAQCPREARTLQGRVGH